MKQEPPIDRSESELWQILYAFCLLGCGMMFFLVLFFGHPLSFPLKLIFLAVFVLTTRVWTGGLVLVLAILNLVTVRADQNGLVMMLRASSWIVISISMVSLISAFRTMREHEKGSAWPMLRRTPELLNFDNPVLFRFAAQLLRVLVAPLLAGAFAFFALVMFPTANSKTLFGLKPDAFRLIFAGFGIFATVSALWLVLNEFLWRKLSRSEASMYLRSITINHLYRDVRSVAKRRVRFRGRRR